MSQHIKKVQSTVHTTAVGTITKQLIASKFEGFLTGATSCNIGAVIKQPDWSFRPYTRITDGPYRDGSNREFPTFVVEVRAEDLENELALWVSDATTVNVAIGIRIGKLSDPMIFYMFTRGQPGHVEINLQTFDNYEVIRIPSELVYHGGHTPRNAAEFFELDLVPIVNEINQMRMEDEQRAEARGL